MTVPDATPSVEPLSPAETALLSAWSSSMGRVSQSFRVTWNGAPAFAGIVATGVTLVRADDSGAEGFPSARFVVTAESDTVRVIAAAGAGASGTPGVRQVLEFGSADVASAFDRARRRSGVAPHVLPRARLDKWTSFLGDFADVVLGLGALVAVLGVCGSIALFVHTDRIVGPYDQIRHTHDLVGYGLAGLMGTAVTTALLVAVGALAKVVVLRTQIERADTRP